MVILSTVGRHFFAILFVLSFCLSAQANPVCSDLFKNPLKKISSSEQALALIKPEFKEELLDQLVLSQSMRQNVDQITYDQMVRYLETISPEVLFKSIKNLEENYYKYFEKSGGVIRDSENSLYREMLRESALAIKENNDLGVLANTQIIYIRLRHFSKEDW